MAIEITTASTDQLSDIRQALQIATIKEVFPHATLTYNYVGGLGIFTYGDTIDFKPLSNCRIINLSTGLPALSVHSGAQMLSSLQDNGTENAFQFQNQAFTAEGINQFFTDLPITTKTVTLDIRGNPGTATCDKTIATNKGYIVRDS